jgi:hypothetical protein
VVDFSFGKMAAVRFDRLYATFKAFKSNLSMLVDSQVATRWIGRLYLVILLLLELAMDQKSNRLQS